MSSDPTPLAAGRPGERGYDWTNIAFLAAAHTLGLAGVAWMVLVHFSWWTLGLALLWFFLCGLGITGGYHRLLAHKSYKSSALVRAFYLFFGAAAVQNSALKWSSDHRLHHAFTDQDRDPYNIRKGFLWAHVGWVLHRDDGVVTDNVRDLAADPLVRFQDRHYVAIAIVAGALLPALLGLLWGDPIGALLVAGFLRLVVGWHATFCVNSLAHTIGTQPYSTKGTARDSFLTALVTLGEGYHNFHHSFQADYRNGVRWFHLDPTKWFVWTLSLVGQTWDLRRIPDETIARARQRVREEAAGRSAA